jgi:hypothetical protein
VPYPLSLVWCLELDAVESTVQSLARDGADNPKRMKLVLVSCAQLTIIPRDAQPQTRRVLLLLSIRAKGREGKGGELGGESSRE